MIFHQVIYIDDPDVSEPAIKANLIIPSIHLFYQHMCWLLGHLPGSSQIFGVKRMEGILVFTLIHYIIWEQHDWQIPSLASRTHQTLDKTCHPSLGLRSSFRFIPQSYRPGRGKRSTAPTTDRPETTDQTTSANRP